MFFLTYLRRELTRRRRQTVVVALGLAIGVGLVVTVTAAAAGVTRAQGEVLHSLYGIGTDITVTTTAAQKAGNRPGPAAQHTDVLNPPQGLEVMDERVVAQIAEVAGVAAAAGGLNLTSTKLDLPAGGGNPLPVPQVSSVAGVDLRYAGLGPYASATVAAGRSFASTDSNADVAVVDARYAVTRGLIVGSPITLANRPFKVVGLAQQPRDGGGADIYIPLAPAQQLATLGQSTLTGKVDTIYVRATDGDALSPVQASISALLPGATVTSSSDLVESISGSLASAAKLAEQIGRWLAAASLVTAFAVASLLTTAGVDRRVREFGTLKAIGWRSRRIVMQVMGEALMTGVLGAVVGVALGVGGSLLIGALAPPLTASLPAAPGAIAENAALADAALGGGGGGDAHTVEVHLTAPVTLTAVLLAVLLAIAGGVAAGCFGGWRAARLRPVEALRRMG